MIVNTKRRAGLDEDIDEQVNVVDFVNEFLHKIEFSAASADSILNAMHDSKDNIIHAGGLCVLLERSDLVQNSLMHRKLCVKLSHHLWAIRREQWTYSMFKSYKLLPVECRVHFFTFFILNTTGFYGS